MPYIKSFSSNLRQRILALFKRQENEISQAEMLLPVVEINDDLSRAQTEIYDATIGSQTTSATLVTTANEERKKFYLTSAELTWHKGTTSDNLEVSVRITQDGAVKKVSKLYSGAGTTVALQSVVIVFKYPLPVDKNTAITLTKDADSLGTSIASAVIHGFYEVKAV